MKLKRLSLRSRIFVAMIMLVLLASVLIAAVSIYQYNEEAREYHRDRLNRKESAIREHINFVLNDRQNTYEIKTENIPLIFKEKIFEIANIHNLQINLYDLEGDLLKSSKATLTNDAVNQCLTAEVLNSLANTASHRVVFKNEKNGQVFQSSYTYITDQKFKNLAILNLPYLENDEFLNKELREFLFRLGYAYLLMILMAVVFAYYISKYITKSLKTISDKLNETRLERRNKKIEVSSSSEEIATLVNAYNSMIDQLEASAVKLATSEREQAWREMAKQVAHEIKNPLTPMRLTIQSFQRKFNPDDPDITQKLQEYSKTLIQQIDTMSSIASAFSSFAKMPAQKSEDLNVVEIVKLALDIFNEPYIHFKADDDKIIAKFDRAQLIRVVTNLVKNSVQSIAIENSSPQITVHVYAEKAHVVISVKDNGIGIPEDMQHKIFEPKFTTKSSGMGLGLAMVKNIIEAYQGRIDFNSNLDQGTTFRVTFPKT